jgi:SAM-dependent methyltransferase
VTTREQRLVFGEDAELYDRARPVYPAAAIDKVVSMAGAPGSTPRRAVEVGAGTGKATVAVAARGVEVTAVEPDPQMAAVLRRNLAGVPGVRVVLSAFEPWEPGPVPFDLLYSAQAWHWIDPAQRYRKAAAALRPGGGLALLWHRTNWPEGDPLRAEIDELYHRIAPDLHAREPGFPGTGARQRHSEDPTDEARASGYFTDLEVTNVEWPSSFDAPSYTALLQTQSDHRLEDPAVIRQLVDAVSELVARHGGRIDVPYRTMVFTARRVSA